MSMRVLLEHCVGHHTWEEKQLQESKAPSTLDSVEDMMSEVFVGLAR